MNALEQLQALGFREEPLRFDTGGGAFDGFSGFDGAGSDSGVTDADISAADAIASLGLTQSSGATVNDAMANVLAEVISENVSKDAASPEGRAVLSALESLDNLGYGRMEGLNAANPTQSVQELIASYNFSLYGAPTIIAAIPGASTASNLAQLASNLSTGKTTAGSAAVDFALSQVASSLGVGKGTIAALINGDYGAAAANVTGGLLNNAIAQATGLPAGVVGFGMGVTGAGKAIGSEIASAVNQATGAATTDNVGAIGRAIDQALGGGPGGAATGSVGSTDNVGTAGDTTNLTGGDVTEVTNTGSTDTDDVPGITDTGSTDLSALAPMLATLGFAAAMTPEEKEKEKELQQMRVRSPFGTIFDMA